MDTTVSYYVRKKVKDDFDKCNWTDGVGKKFEDVALTEMLKALDELETALEETEKFFTNAESILADTASLPPRQVFSGR